MNRWFSGWADALADGGICGPVERGAASPRIGGDGAPMDAFSILRRLMQGDMRLKYVQRLRQLRRIVLLAAFPQAGKTDCAAAVDERFISG